MEFVYMNRDYVIYYDGEFYQVYTREHLDDVGLDDAGSVYQCEGYLEAIHFAEK